MKQSTEDFLRGTVIVLFVPIWGPLWLVMLLFAAIRDGLTWLGRDYRRINGMEDKE